MVTAFHPYSILSVIVSTSLWASLYFIARLYAQERTPEFANRIITLLHGTIISFWGAKECFREGWIYNHPDSAEKCSQELALLISLGYFIFDLIWCLYYKTETNLMIGHHVYSIFALCRLLVRRKYWGQSGCALGGMEATNPLLQLRWFIRSFGYHRTPLFRSVESVFVFSFIFLRIVVGTIIMFYIMFTGNYDFEFKFLAVLIYLVSWAFVVNMINYVRRKYFAELPTELPNDNIARDSTPVNG